MALESLHALRSAAMLGFWQALDGFWLQIRRPDGLRRLLARMGWHLDGLGVAEAEALVNATSTLRATVLELLRAANGPIDTARGAAMAAAVQRIEGECEDLKVALEGLVESLGATPDPAIAAELLTDLQEFLLLDWLSRHAPIALTVADALGLLRWEPAAPIPHPADPSVLLRWPQTRRTLPLLRLVSLAVNPMSLLSGGGSGTVAALQEEVDRLLQGLRDRAQAFVGAGVRIRLRPDRLDWFLAEPALLSDPSAASLLRFSLPGGGDREIGLAVGPSNIGLVWGGMDAEAGSAFVLLDVDGFVVTVGDPAGDEDALPALTLRLGAAPELVVAGVVQIDLPESWISDDGGARLKLRGAGSVGMRLGESLTVAIDALDVALSGLQIGGTNGVTIEAAALRLRDLRFPMETWPSLHAGGIVSFAGARVTMEAFLDADHFRLLSSATVDLGSSIRFEPVAGQPVLSLEVPLGGSGVLNASLAGTVRLPGESGLQSVAFQGSIALLMDGGRLELQTLNARAEVTGSWTLPGGIEVREVAILLVHDANGFAIEISGLIGIGEGTVTLDKARFALSEERVALEAEITASDVVLGDVARIRSGTVSLAVSAATDGTTYSGMLGLKNAAFDLVRSDANWLLEVHDLAATLEVGPPFRLAVTSGRISFPLPFAPEDPAQPGAPQRLEVVLETLALEIGPSGSSLTGSWHVPDEVLLWDEGGFRLALHAGTAFALSLGGPAEAWLRMAAGVRFIVSEEALKTVDGIEEVAVAIAGTTTLALGDVPRLSFENVDLELSGSFRLGGIDALTLTNATLRLKNLERIGRATPTEPFEITVGGKLRLNEDGPALEVLEARFRFEGPGLPTFEPGGIGVAAGSFGDGLPLKVDEARFEIIDTSRPFPASIAVDNLRLGVSVGLDLPIGGDGAAVMARVDGIEVELTGAWPVVTVDGLGFGVDGLSLGLFEVSGLLYLGGLGALSSLPQQLTGGLPPGQRPFFIAGKVGGRYNGTKLEVLLAFRPDRPLGACLDVAIDGGIPIVYGFTVNGVSGGISFANRAGDPCDLRSYLSFSDEGVPSLEDTGWAPEPGEHSFTEGRAAKPETGCDCACPPPSMNPLCQPHPDGAAFPGRAILKFSAISESLLEEWGLLALIDGMGSDVHAGVAGILDQLRAQLAPMVPVIPDGVPLPAGMPAELVQMARDPVGAVLDALEPRILEALSGGGAAARQHFISTLAAGIECPDLTLQVTGTFSYTGVGYFLTLTGGINLGTTGAGGVVGSVNLFGMPIGTLRAFISGTDEQGLPQTSLCGDLEFAFGPLELGRLCLTATAPSVERVVLEAVIEHLPSLVGLAGHAGGELLEQLLDAAGVPLDTDPQLAIGTLELEHAVAMVEALGRQGVATLPALQAWVGGVFATIWDGFDPEITACGIVQPRIFGIGLTPELATVEMLVRKDRMTAATTVSLSKLLIAAVSPAAGALAMTADFVTISMSAGFPDPVEVGIEVFLGLGVDPDVLRKAVEQEADRLLSETFFAVELRFAPFGLELAELESRILLPDLTQYPGPAWSPPSGRGGILSACLDQDLLIDPVWTGDLGPIGLFGEDLRRDWFPHGGVVGAGRLRLPRLLVEAPPIELFQTILGDADVLAKLGALVSLVSDHLTQTSDVGEVAFYVPAPTAPSNLDGTLFEQLGQLAEFAQTGGIRSDLFFAGGRLTGSFLGMALGEVEATLEIPGVDRPGRLLLSGETAGGWIEELVGRVEVTLEVTTPPPLPIALFFSIAEKLLGQLLTGTLTASKASAIIALAAADRVDDPELRARLREHLEVAFAAMLEGGPLAVRRQRAVQMVTDGLSLMLPKVALEAAANDLALPPPLKGLFTVAAVRVAGYSPFYDPASAKPEPLGGAQRTGGVLLEVVGAQMEAFGWKASLSELLIACRGDPSGLLPMVDGRGTVDDVDVPGLELEMATVSFSNHHPAHAKLEVRATELGFTWARWLPAPGTSHVVLDVDALSGRASVSPSVLQVGDPIGLADAEILVHGTTAQDPFSFSLESAWSAALTVASLALHDPLSGVTWSVEDVADARIAGDGLSLDKVEGSIELQVPPLGPLTVLGVELTPEIALGVAVHFTGRLVGFDGGITGEAHGHFHWNGRELTFSTGTFEVHEVSVAALLGVARDAVLRALQEAFLSFDFFADAMIGGLLPTGFDPLQIGHLLGRVYNRRGVAEVTQALGQLQLTPAQIQEVLDALFSFVPHADLPLVPHIDEWLFHQDGFQHKDAVWVPHVDETFGAHTDGHLHHDAPAGHLDSPLIHQDLQGTAHVDIDPVAHVDITPVGHGDLDTQLHVDIPRGVHGDAGTGIFHNDSYLPPHGDLPGLHTDVPAILHGDIDFKGHVDVAPTLHVDTAIPHGDAQLPPPHADGHTHQDVAPLHADVAESHADGREHHDLAGVHLDVGGQEHGDQPAMHRSEGRDGSGHGDAPSMPHLDQAAMPHVDTDAPSAWHVDSPPIPHGDGVRRHVDSGPSGSGGRGGAVRPTITPILPGRGDSSGGGGALPPRGVTRHLDVGPPHADRSGASGGRSGTHTDRPVGHGDRGGSVAHRDTAGSHLDRPARHIDRAAEPHGDEPPAPVPHQDYGPFPHGDRPAQPHVDIGGAD